MSEPTETTVQVLEFDFMEYHCHHDPGEVLEDIPDVVKAAVDDYRGAKALDDYDPYDWGQLADHLDREGGQDDETYAAFEEAATQIRDAMHSDGCDCDQWEFDSFTEWVDDTLSGFIPHGALVAVYKDDDDERAELSGESLTYEELRDTFAGDGYDGVKLKLDPTTGTGELCFSDRGWGGGHQLYVETDPDRVRFANMLANRDENSQGDPPLRHLHGLDLTLVLEELIEVLVESPATIPVKWWSGTISQTELRAMESGEALAAMKKAGVFDLSEEEQEYLVEAGKNWKGQLSHLVLALKATA